jgi:hypothetical protein
VNDLTAVGALRELRERGLRVPQDMSVTGFDNVKLSEFCYPALTTVHIPRERIGHIILQPAVSGCLQSDEIVIDPEICGARIDRSRTFAPAGALAGEPPSADLKLAAIKPNAAISGCRSWPGFVNSPCLFWNSA